MKAQAPILEFDPEPKALIEPSRYHRKIDVAEHCLVTFFQDVIDRLAAAGRLRVVKEIATQIGKHFLYELEVDARRLALIHPGIGASLAAGLLEVVIARGCRKFVVCGGAGVLDSSIAAGRAIVLGRALRDEGTSYHYLPPGHEAALAPALAAALEDGFGDLEVPVFAGASWTTDAPFRETQSGIDHHARAGIACVEMEAAALYAYAQSQGAAVVCVAHLTNEMGRQEIDFEKGAADGATETLTVVARIADLVLPP